MDLSIDQLRMEGDRLGDRFFPIACDVSKAGDVGRAFETVLSKTGSLDALICSAGIFRTGPLLEMAESDFDALFAVNAKGSWLAAKAALPMLAKSARVEAPARIVFLGSIASIRPKVGGGAYSASKTALAQLARVLAVELAGRHILVNVVAPATVDTPMTQRLKSDSGYRLSGTSPLGRVAQSSDVTAVIQFLLSSASNYVTGAILPVDGGTSAAYDPK
jgi:NAD(P)-dependent dehydrogenase (short-subunit alcohol dehydrogenase family)